MPDITMCDGAGCPLAASCYRAWAEPNELQSYFVGVPYDHEAHHCGHHWPAQRNRNTAGNTETREIKK